MHPKVKRYRFTPTIAINDDLALCVAGAEGIVGTIRAISVTAPSLTGSSYTAAVPGHLGESIYSKASLTAAANTVILKDADTAYLAIPVVAAAGDTALSILVAGDSDATGVLTSAQTNALANETVTLGTQVYKFVTTLTGAANEILIAPNTKATGTFTSDNTNPSDGETVTIGATTYRFKTTPVAVNDVFLDATVADTTMGHLIKTINGTGVAGTDYFAGSTTPNASASAGALTSHAFPLTALSNTPATGNAVVTTETSAHLSFGATTLTGGAYTGDTTLAHLVSAINGTSGSGTTYGIGTVANSFGTAGSVTSHATTITASAIPATAVATTSTSADLTWGATHLTGGGEASARQFTVDLYVERF